MEAVLIQLKNKSKYLMVMVVAIAMLTLITKNADVNFFLKQSLFFTSMKSITATCFLMITGAIMLMIFSERSPWNNSLIYLLSLCTLLIGVLELIV